MSQRNETPLVAAKREAREEGGVTRGTWKALGYVNTSPGIIKEFAYIFFARNVVFRTPQPDAEELQVVIKMPFAKAYRWACQGKINDAMTIAALTRVKNLLKL